MLQGIDLFSCLCDIGEVVRSLEMDFEQKIIQRLDKTSRAKSEVRVASRPETSNFYVKKEDKYNYVEHRLLVMKPCFLELLGIEEFESVNCVSSSSFYTYGMIISADGCRLSPSNMCICSNIDDSNDVVVRLSVSHLQRYSVFPGQVVAVRGKNPTGTEIVVEILHCMPVLDVNTVNANKERQQVQPSIIAVSGPYSEPEFGTLDTILGNVADILILVGPFVTCVQHTTECSPMSTMKVFMSKVTEWLEKNIQGKIVLVPSVSDLTCVNVFPQPPIDVEHDRIYCVGNPGEFFLNGYLVAVSSLDVLLELSSEECFRDSGVPDKKDMCGELLFRNDRTDRISYHLVFQKTFLPVFPSINTVSYSVPDAASMNVAPDICMTASKLRYFCREAGPSLVVNLGSQAKATNKVLCHVRLPRNKDEKPAVEFTRLK